MEKEADGQTDKRALSFGWGGLGASRGLFWQVVGRSMKKIWYVPIFGYSKTQLALNHPVAAPLPSLAVTRSPRHLGGSPKKSLGARGRGGLQGLIVTWKQTDYSGVIFP